MAFVTPKRTRNWTSFDDLYETSLAAEQRRKSADASELSIISSPQSPLRKRPVFTSSFTDKRKKPSENMQISWCKPVFCDDDAPLLIASVQQQIAPTFQELSKPKNASWVQPIFDGAKKAKPPNLNAHPNFGLRLPTDDFSTTQISMVELSMDRTSSGESSDDTLGIITESEGSQSSSFHVEVENFADADANSQQQKKWQETHSEKSKWISVEEKKLKTKNDSEDSPNSTNGFNDGKSKIRFAKDGLASRFLTVLRRRDSESVLWRHKMDYSASESQAMAKNLLDLRIVRAEERDGVIVCQCRTNDSPYAANVTVIFRGETLRKLTLNNCRLRVFSPYVQLASNRLSQPVIMGPVYFQLSP